MLQTESKTPNVSGILFENTRKGRAMTNEDQVQALDDLLRAWQRFEAGVRAKFPDACPDFVYAVTKACMDRAIEKLTEGK